MMVVEANGIGGVHEVPRMLSAIDRLYGRFASMYMHKWSSHFTTPAAIADWKKAWSSALVSEGISPGVAFEAVDRCRTEYPKWAPSEGEFIALCKPPLDYEQAFLDAVRELRRRKMNDPEKPPVWPHPSLYWAAVDFGQFELLQASYGQVAARWKKLLDNRRASACPDVPEYVPQLAAPARNAEGVAITSTEARAAALAALSTMHLKKPSREVAAAKARATIARHEAGELIPVYLVTHARDALARLEGSALDDDEES